MKNIAFLLLLFCASSLAIAQDGVFIHTDRDIYQAGETLNYKAYVYPVSEAPKCASEFLNIYLMEKATMLFSTSLMALP